MGESVDVEHDEGSELDELSKSEEVSESNNEWVVNLVVQGSKKFSNDTNKDGPGIEH